MTRRGDRGSEISGFVTLYQSQSSAVGLGQAWISTEETAAILHFVHKAKEGISVAVRWEYGLWRRRSRFVSGLFEVEFKIKIGGNPALSRARHGSRGRRVGFSPTAAGASTSKLWRKCQFQTQQSRFLRGDRFIACYVLCRLHGPLLKISSTTSSR